MLNSLKNKNRNKYGFSLFEVCVTMAIVVVFIAACTNVFTTKHKARVQDPVHGRYECYRDDNNQIWEQMFNENNPVTEPKITDTGCFFRPPRYADYITVNAVAAGGNGGDEFGGTAGNYTSMFLSSATENFRIIPGFTPTLEDEKEAYGSDENGGSSRDVDRITEIENARETVLYTGEGDTRVDFIRLKGGHSGVDPNIGFRNCSVAGTRYNLCGVSPTCTLEPKAFENANTQNPGGVKLSFCINDSAYSSVTVPYQRYTTVGELDEAFWKLDGCDNVSDVRSANKKVAPICSSDTNSCGDNGNEQRERVIPYTFIRRVCANGEISGVIEYITVNLEVDGNFDGAEELSDMDSLINTLGLVNGVANKRENSNRRMSVGNGGAKNERGGQGSVVISW